jgi:uncharacterized membrane protein YhaH (DUF805 family)
MHWYTDVLKKYAQFTGRARRQEFWMFTLFSVGIAIVLGIIGGLIGFSLLSTLYSLAVLVPSVAVGVRRLHDTGRSGWFMLLALIPVIGLVLIYFLAIEGEKSDNAFGPDPKAA